MKNFCRLLLVWGCCGSFFLFVKTTQVSSQMSYVPPENSFNEMIEEKLERNISLDLRDINIVDVLSFLSKKADLNIVPSQSLDLRVTLFLKEVSIGGALDIILLSSKLAIQEQDNILYVMTEAEYQELYGETYRDQREVKLIQIKYTDPEKVGTILTGLKSSIGRIIVDAQTGTIVVMDTPEKIHLMESAIKRVDISTVERVVPTTSKVFELSYNEVADIEAKVLPLLTPGIGTVQTDDKTNRFLVTDLPHAIEKVAAMIEAFDRKTRQVLIKAKILQVRLNNEYQMGINWQYIFNEGLRESIQVDATSSFGITPGASFPTQFGRLVVGDLSRNDFLATIDFIHTFGDTKTLASPHIMVQHKEEATILVGTKEAFVTSTVSQADSTTTTSESITFIDVGVQLRVLPVINKDKFISLKITPEVSAVGRTLTTSNGNQIPIVDTTNATTQVLVKHGRTIMIGGLMKDDISKAVQKLPILGDIPVIGSAFRFTDDNNTKTELVIFLTPYIVEGDEEQPFSPTASAKKFESFKEFEPAKEFESV